VSIHQCSLSLRRLLNRFRIIFRGEYQGQENNGLKHKNTDAIVRVHICSRSFNNKLTCTPIVTTSFPGSSLYLEKVTWLRLVTSLLDFNRRHSTAALMHSFRVWYVQCLAKILTLNLIEFIQSKVWRSFDSIAVKNFMKNWTTMTSATRSRQNPTAFVSKLFSGKSNFRSKD